MTEITADVLGLDWNSDMGEARALFGSERVLQGNVDPSVLFASEVCSFLPRWQLHR
jgi:uroporphyrinogen decarboxylase